MAESYDTGGLLTLEPQLTSSQSTVSVDIEQERREQSLISDIECTQDVKQSVSPVPAKGGKVEITDLFKRLRPAAVKKSKDGLPQDSPESGASEEAEPEPPGDLPMSDDVVVIASDDRVEVSTESATSKQVGVSARDLLTGFRSRKKPEADEDLETIVVENDLIEMKPKRKLKPVANSKQKNAVKKKPKKATVDHEVVELLTSGDEDEPIIALVSQAQRIAELEQKMKNASTKSVSAKDLLRSFGRREEQTPVTTEPDELIVVEDSFKTKGTRVPGVRSFLDVLSDKPSVRKSTISKLKELDPPVIKREELHVTYNTKEIEHRLITLPKKHDVVLPVINYNEPDNFIDRSHPSKDIYQYTILNSDAVTLAKERIKTLDENCRFQRFKDMLESEMDSNDMWTNYFQPKTADDILLDPLVVRRMQSWLQNSYKILKKRTKRHNFKKGKRAIYDDLDDFIVGEDEEETEDDEYTPLAIISGPPGVGKSSAVYALVEETFGYVYEINASQARGRKDILDNVSELSTTQFVHQNQETTRNSGFQNGIILFEDVDILFESDRSFWSVIENALTISRRPIILTCSDVSVIPQNILDCGGKEGSIFHLEKQSLGLLSEYLYLAGLCKGLDVDQEVLQNIVESNMHDLRKCLLNLQLICQVQRPMDGDVTRVSFKDDKKELQTIDEVHNLAVASQTIDTYSVADVIHSNTFSLIRHDAVLTEVLSLDPYLLEDELRTALLPFELNMSEALTQDLPMFPCARDNRTIQDSNDIRKADKQYLSSKVRGARMTRRAISNLQQFTSELETNYDNTVFELLPTPAYITDISPILREFCRFDQEIRDSNARLRQLKEEDGNDDEDEMPVTKRRRKRSEMIAPLEARQKFNLPPSTLLSDELKAWKD